MVRIVGLNYADGVLYKSKTFNYFLHMEVREVFHFPGSTHNWMKHWLLFEKTGAYTSLALGFPESAATEQQGCNIGANVRAITEKFWLENTH